MATKGTLLWLREQFVKKSGRFNLVSDYSAANFADNGANLYLQAGQRFLDLTQDNPYSQAEHKVDLVSGDYYALVPYLRSVTAVWLYSVSSQSRTRLTPKSISWLKEEYPEQFADVTPSVPEYFSDEVFNLGPDQNLYTAMSEIQAAVAGEETDFTYDFDGLLADNTFSNRGILIMSPADGVYTLTVEGRFFSKLTEETEYTYWTKNYPELSLFAGLFMLEAFYRNTTGMNDWIAAMRPFLNGIDKDEVFREMSYAGNTIRG